MYDLLRRKTSYKFLCFYSFLRLTLAQRVVQGRAPLQTRPRRISFLTFSFLVGNGTAYSAALHAPPT